MHTYYTLAALRGGVPIRLSPAAEAPGRRAQGPQQHTK